MDGNTYDLYVGDRNSHVGEVLSVGVVADVAQYHVELQGQLRRQLQAHFLTGEIVLNLTCFRCELEC